MWRYHSTRIVIILPPRPNPASARAPSGHRPDDKRRRDNAGASLWSVRSSPTGPDNNSRARVYTRDERQCPQNPIVTHIDGRRVTYPKTYRVWWLITSALHVLRSSVHNFRKRYLKTPLTVLFYAFCAHNIMNTSVNTVLNGRFKFENKLVLFKYHVLYEYYSWMWLKSISGTCLILWILFCFRRHPIIKR